MSDTASVAGVCVSESDNVPLLEECDETRFLCTAALLGGNQKSILHVSRAGLRHVRGVRTNRAANFRGRNFGP